MGSAEAPVSHPTYERRRPLHEGVKDPGVQWFIQVHVCVCALVTERDNGEHSTAGRARVWREARRMGTPAPGQGGSLEPE